MSGMASAERRRQILLGLLILVALVPVFGHFVADAVCLALPAEAGPCASRLQAGTAARPSGVCGWHTGPALALLPVLAMPLVLLTRQRAVRPRSLFAVFAPPFQPPIAALTA